MNIRKLSLTTFIFLLLIVLLPVGARASAAAKPKAKESNITLTTDSGKYTIELKNVSENATLKYSSSNKKVATVKNGVVTPKKAGKATITVKVKQNGKTYKVKVKFTITEPVSDTPDYDVLAKQKVEALKSSLIKDTNTILKYDESLISKTAEDIKTNIIKGCKEYTRFSLYFSDIKDLDLLRSEEEYLTMFPALKELSIDEVVQYKNVIMVKVTTPTIRDMYDDEYSIDAAIATNDTSLLNSDELALYKQVISLAKELKGKTEYDTVKNIHDYLVLNIAYPTSYSGKGVHTLNYALNEGICICDGYSKAFYFLCRANGIECIIIKGTSINQSGNIEDHAWNKVKVNGKWYVMDVTWDDPIPDKPGRVKYHYFLVTDADASKTHDWDDTGLPKATSNDLGIVYSEYANVTSVTGKSEAADYLKKELEKCSLENKTSAEIQFFESSMDKATYTELQSIFADFCKKNYYGGSIGYESVGFYGYLYTITISK